MISAALSDVIETARAMVPRLSMNEIPAGTDRRVEAPAAFQEFLRVADGLIAGSIVVFGANYVGEAQFLADPVEGAPVALGRDEWFCIGKVHDDPLFISRADGVIWWHGERFERLADDLDQFLSEYVFGARYLPLATANDPWLPFLVRMGRAT